MRGERATADPTLALHPLSIASSKSGYLRGGWTYLGNEKIFLEGPPVGRAGPYRLETETQDRR